MNGPPNGQEMHHDTDTRAEAQSALKRAMPPGATYKVAEAALMAGLHEDTVRRRIRAGKLRTWGSPQRVLLADLLAPNTPGCRQKQPNTAIF